LFPFTGEEGILGFRVCIPDSQKVTPTLVPVQVMRNPSEKRRLKQASSEIPLPSLPFPWDAFPDSSADAEDDNKFDVA